MTEETVQGNFALLVVMFFAASLLLLEALYFFWEAKRGQAAVKLSRRMQALTGRVDPRMRVQVTREARLSGLPGLERWLTGRPRVEAVQRLVIQAGSRLTVMQVVMTSALMGSCILLSATELLHWRWGPAVLLGSTAALLPVMWLAFRRSRRLEKIRRQLPDALDFMTRGLRSGQAFSSALMMAGEELAEPIAGEFRTAADEITFGISLEQALSNMSNRLPITDLRYFVVAVLIQRDSGGNLTEVLDNLSRLIRERYKLMAKIRVLAADGKFSAWILILMPFALAAAMNSFNPKFMTPLWTDPMGISLLKILAFMMLIGIILLRKIVRIRV